MDGAGCRCHVDGQGDVLICRCEEVSEAEIDAALDLGLNSLDEIKKFTRAGMGLCPGEDVPASCCPVCGAGSRPFSR